MIKCRMGLVSFPILKPGREYKDVGGILFIGEIFDKKIRCDVSALYKVHCSLVYTTSFFVNFGKSNENISADNLAELFELQKRFKLTRRIYTEFAVISNIIVKYTSPKLYDLDCNVPLFSDIKPCRQPSPLCEGDICIFILLPCADPVTRGYIIDNCLTAAQGHKTKFCSVGTKKANFLVKRSLKSVYNTDDGDIITTAYENNMVENILEAVTVSEFIFSPSDTSTIYICVQREMINTISGYIRNIHRSKIISRRLRLICDDY